MSNEIKYFSMFTGVGGFELGLERAGQLCNKNEGIHRPTSKNRNKKGSSLESNNNRSKRFACVGVSEIDKYASQLLKQKFPKVKNYGDARKINPGELPNFDLLVGGFPCQAFSIAGKRKGFTDTRGTLFFEIARILKIKRPRILLLENVKGLLNHEEGKTFTKILQTLEELGYETQWMVLNSKFHGVPQNRERVFIIGNLRGESRQEILPLRQNDSRINESYEENSQTQVAPTIDQRVGASTHRSPYVNIGDFRYDEGFRIRKDQISPTLRQENKGMDKSKSVLVFRDPLIRRLTPLECERLQGFPDQWTANFSDSQRYKMMGNAVTVNVIAVIGSKLI